jgi:hypothetical protein
MPVQDTMPNIWHRLHLSIQVTIAIRNCAYMSSLQPVCFSLDVPFHTKCQAIDYEVVMQLQVEREESNR